jgi:hypothetical protein
MQSGNKFYFDPSSDFLLTTSSEAWDAIGEWLVSGQASMQLSDILEQVVFTSATIRSFSSANEEMRTVHARSPDFTVRVQVITLILAVLHMGPSAQVMIVHDVWDGVFAESFTKRNIATMSDHDTGSFRTILSELDLLYEGDVIDSLPSIKHMTVGEFEEMHD